MTLSPNVKSVYFAPLILLILLAGCIETATEPDPSSSKISGYLPVYGTPDVAEIKWLAARTVTDPGKIYVYGQYLLINERGQGIHVYDNADPTDPQALGFIQILGNSDMAIKDNVLYADHLGNLLNISISHFSDVRENDRLELQDWNLGVPPPSGSYFECVDPAKGVVVSWKKAELKNTDCYAIQ